MKHILIDGTVISSEMNGLSQYILSIVRMLGENHSTQTRYLLLLRHGECNDKYLQLLQKVNIEVEYADISPIGPMREFKMWRYLKANKLRFDEVYIPSNQYPYTLKDGIYTIHDLTYEQFPEQLGRLAKLKKIYLHWIVRRGLKRSKRIIAISEYTKNNILRFHKVNGLESKIEVIYEGWEHLITPHLYLDNSIVKPFKNYFFYVGSSRGHKNLSRLLQAFNKIKNEIDWGLVIIGNINHLLPVDKEFSEVINSSRQRVIFTGWVSESVLVTYFKNASAFVFPSLSEGFGIPVLEAFFYGVPLLCSNNTVFPEIAGEASLYFDPFSVESIAETMVTFANRKELFSSKLISIGKTKLEYFTWKEAATKIHNILIT